MTTPTGQEKSSLRQQHGWVLEASDPFVAYLRDTNQLLHLAMVGISRMTEQEALVRALVNYDVLCDQLEEPTEHHQAQLDQAKEEAKLARREVDLGFPLLHAHALLGLWGAFEAMVENVLVAWLCNVPESLQRAELAGVKIELAAFETMSREDRMRLVAEHIQRGKVGIGRFEAGLAAVGLGGSIPTTTKKALIEMEAVRNVWAHRGGVTDERFTRRCPWYPAKVGERVTVSYGGLAVYATECMNYVTEIIQRCERALSLRSDKAAQRLRDGVLSDEPG